MQLARRWRERESVGGGGRPVCSRVLTLKISSISMSLA